MKVSLWFGSWVITGDYQENSMDFKELDNFSPYFVQLSFPVCTACWEMKSLGSCADYQLLKKWFVQLHFFPKKNWSCCLASTVRGFQMHHWWFGMKMHCVFYSPKYWLCCPWIFGEIDEQSWREIHSGLRKAQVSSADEGCKRWTIGAVWKWCGMCGTGGSAEVMLGQQQGCAEGSWWMWLLEIYYCCMEGLGCKGP